MTLEKAVLTALQNVAPYLEPEPALLTDVNALRGGQPIALTQLRAVLEALEAQRQIVSVASSDSEEPVKYRITENGQGRLAAG